jgi:hypothetical protein
VASEQEREYISCFLLKIKFILEADTVTTCFGFAHLIYAKLKCTKNKSENMKTKARNSKMKLFNVVKLRKCENHRFVFGYFYYKSADKL